MKTQMNSPDANPTWHALDTEQVLKHLTSLPEGLSEDEVQRRLGEHGANRIPPPKRRSALMRLLAQFHNVLIYVLIVASVVTAMLLW